MSPRKAPTKAKSNEAETRFKAVVHQLLDRGDLPSPVLILTEMGRAIRLSGDGGSRLNGTETKWRREVLEERGWTYDGQRWQKRAVREPIAEVPA